MIGTTVKVIVDRPLGTYHPKHKDIYYSVNYGYIPGVMAPDGEEQDAYILGVSQPVEEFFSYSIDIIMNSIEENPEVALHPVYGEKRGLERIIGMDTESSITGEGIRTFDIRFYAIVPGKDRIKIIINVEAQKDYYAGYCYETRGIFYCARMISEQLDTEFTGYNYNYLKKVYSIWICMETPELYENTITSCNIKKEDLY